MEQRGDPEQRIRDLERSLSAGRQELTEPSTTTSHAAPRQPPPWQETDPPKRPGWVGPAVAVAVVAVLVGTVVAALFAGRSPESADRASMEPSSAEAAPPVPPVSAGDLPVIPSTALPDVVISAPEVVSGTDDSISLAGVGSDRSLACTGNDVTISGVDNTVALTGPCDQVTVSGMRNTVTVESANAIGVSGFENRVSFGGDPQISTSGFDNVVEPG